MSSPALAPTPAAAPSRDSLAPGQAYARPVPVPSRPSSAPICGAAAWASGSDADPLGNLDDLADLDDDERLIEVCARVFAAVYEPLVADGTLPVRDQSTETTTAARIRDLLRRVAGHHPGLDVDFWTGRLLDEVLGLGKLEPYLARDDLREIFIHGPGRALIRRSNLVPQPADIQFSSPLALEAAVRRLTGTWFSAEQPVVDARTFGGAEVYAVHDTVAPGGPVVTIRSTAEAEPLHSLEQLLKDRALPPAMANLLSACIQGGLNIAICAGPGAQAFPWLAALAEAAPEHHRQLVVRPTHEPGLLPVGAVVLEGEGLMGADGATVMQALVRTAVGLSPDRLLVHEIAGPEAADVFAAMGRGLRGTILTTRAGSAHEGLQRLASLLGLAGTGGDLPTRGQHVAASIELILVVSRFSDGQTRLTQVAEPVLTPDGRAHVVELMNLDPRTRSWTHTGAIPSFSVELQRRGIAVDMGTG